MLRVSHTYCEKEKLMLDNKLRIIDVKESILENNDADADKLREELRAEGTFYLNIMSSPGSGKTSSILRIIEELRDEFKLGILEADIDGDCDARTILGAGIPAIQIHTGGMCHLDADMSRQGLREIDSRNLDLIILENVGNLVCPAEFDTGAVRNLVILSVPEGDDKPLKYPLMFEKADIVLLNKIDALEAFDFDIDKFRENVKLRNSEAGVIPVSAATGLGFGDVAEWIRDEMKEFLGN